MGFFVWARIESLLSDEESKQKRQCEHSEQGFSFVSPFMDQRSEAELILPLK